MGETENSLEESSKRLFIGARISVDFTRELEDYCLLHRDKFPGARWVEPTNYHVTLRFLGWTKNALHTAIYDKVEQGIKDTKRFGLSLGALDAFPEVTEASAVFASVGKGTAELGALAQKLETVLVDLGFSPDKRSFRPHVTVARLSPSADISSLLQKLPLFSPQNSKTSEVFEITMFESVLGGGRFSSQYRSLFTWPIQ